MRRAALVGVLAVAMSGAVARAEIVHVPMNTIMTPGPWNFLEYEVGNHYYYLRFLLDYNPTTQRASVGVSELGTPPASPPVSYNFMTDVPGGPLRNVTPGTLIGRPYTNAFADIAFAHGIPAAEPFEFIIGIENLNYSDDVRYAWLRMSFSPGNGLFTLVDMAYETEPGVPIVAGQIPTPGALAVLALSALASTRRRRS
jgi:MYXO-CTERM domain-containing protein